MLLNDRNELITLDDLCGILMIGKSTAYKLLQSQQIHSFRIGRVWKIPRSSVDEYIQRSTME